MMGLRLAIRSLRLNHRYSVIIVLTLAVCIGATSGIFAIVDSVLLRPLPGSDTDQIVLMGNRYLRAGAGETAWSAGGDYYDRKAHVSGLKDQAMFNRTFRILETNNSAEQVVGMVATPSLFRLLRVSPERGRVFEDAEGETGNELKVILSHDLWRSRYAGDPGIVGREIRLSGRAYTVVGVMPEGFLFFDPDVRFWIPLAFTSEQRQARHSNNWFNVGRLMPGVTVAQVQSQVNALNAQNLERFPQMREVLINAGFETKVMSLKEFLIRDIRGSLRLLAGAALLLLLIGALNAAGLVVARTSAQRKELGTRLALGAGVGRLAAQIVMENLTLAVLGGILAPAIAFALLAALKVTGLNDFPRANEVHLDGTAVLFSIAISILTGLAISMLSIAHLTKLNVNTALADLSRSSTGRRSIAVFRRGLVVGQIALTFVLLATAVLLLASFRELLRVQPGYEINAVLTASTTAPASRYPGADELNALMTRCLRSVRGIPGVISAGATSAIPLGGNFNDSVILAEGYAMKPGESVISPHYIGVTPGYFDAMGIRLLWGRGFADRDTANSLPVIIIDRKLADKFWPRMNPVGRRMYQPSSADVMKTDEKTRWLTVVGVVESVRMQDLAGTGNEAGAYYLPYSQSVPRNFTLALKTRAGTLPPTAAFRGVMADVDPLLALFDVRTMAERAAASLASRKAVLILSLSFGSLSLFLAAVGLYGLLTYLVTQRRREIGIRMAVGCTPSRIFRLFMNEVVLLTGIGTVCGLGVAAAGHAATQKLLYGVRPMEPLVLGITTGVLVFIAFLATALPAWQAARVNPAITLNQQ